MKKFRIFLVILCIITVSGIGFYKQNVKAINDFSELKDIDYEYLGNQYIKVKNFPLQPQEHQIQGKFKITDITDEVIMDMNLPNEAVPHGAQDRQKVGGWFPFDDISMPSDYNYINPWGQIFIIDGEEYPENAKLHIKNLALLVYRKSTGAWEVINNPKSISGGFYRENYTDETIQKADIDYTSNGITVDIDSSSKGRCFHFWTPAVEIDDPSDILYVTSYCDAWVTGDDCDKKFVLNAGADYRKRIDGSDKIKEVVGGRFKILGSEVRRAYATNLSYDKYFEICNQNIIDSVY